jgi:hypothetical protein
MYQLLRKEIRQKIPQPRVFTDWREPTTGALLGSPPARFGASSWTPDPDPVIQSIMARDADLRSAHDIEMQSYTDARRLSNTARPQWPSDSEAKDAFGQSVKYLENIITTRTAKEKRDYELICERMSSCDTRPAGADQIPANPGWRWKWLAISRDDDWWHRRRLLQMIFHFCPSHFDEKSRCRFEERLLMLLAAIEGGSTEALLWLMPLEGLLREISQSALQKESDQGNDTKTEVILRSWYLLFMEFQ